MMSWVKLNIRIPGVFFFFFLFERILKFSVAACIPKKPSPNSFEFSHSEQHSRLFWTRYSTFCRGEKLPVSIPPSYNLPRCTLSRLDGGKTYIPEISCCRSFFSLQFQVFSASGEEQTKSWENVKLGPGFLRYMILNIVSRTVHNVFVWVAAPESFW